MTPLDEAGLLAEANRINYRLRSTFFYRKIKEYDTLALPSVVAELYPVEGLYSWEMRDQWGIGDAAFSYILSKPEFHLIQVFCHPGVIRDYPQLISYYRNVAALSQKSVSYMAKVNVKPFETQTNRIDLPAFQALALAKLFNEHISLIIDSSIESFTAEELLGLLLTSTGTQIDGSWRNAIGEEAEKVMHRLLIREAKTRGVLAALIPRSPVGPVVELYDPAHIDEQLGRVEQYRGFKLDNGTSLLFSSEPDIEIRNEHGETVCAIEVKGGADPAGALERFAAATKSFNEVLRTAPGTLTVLVASCITAEVHARIKNDASISSYYNLTEILSEGSTTYSDLMQELFAVAGVAE